MDMENTLPTRGQLERQLSQTLQSLYRQQFGHMPKRITCHIFADKVAIVAEDTITTIERILFENSKIDLAQSIRIAISQTFVTQVREIISKILQVEIVDIVGDSTINSGYLGLIVFLKNPPELRLAKKKTYNKTALAVQSESTIDKPS